jgi:predicted alpha/beta-hydrolase family hydrolase
MMTDTLPHIWTGRGNTGPVIILAHGAGAPMDSPFMLHMAEDLAERDLRVLRFEFPYMAKRREDGKKRPPDRMPVLEATFRQVVEMARKSENLGPEEIVIGGKSMGGRVASMVADDLGVRGLVCLGYPFHPPGKPERTRTEHLADLATPALILQGERDPFGSHEEVAGYALSPKIEVRWIEDGNHDLAPRKASGLTTEGNWRSAADAIADFIRRI